MDASHGGLKLVSKGIYEKLDQIDVSVLMGANIASEVAKEMFCEATIGECTGSTVCTVHAMFIVRTYVRTLCTVCSVCTICTVCIVCTVCTVCTVCNIRMYCVYFMYCVYCKCCCMDKSFVSCMLLNWKNRNSMCMCACMCACMLILSLYVRNCYESSMYVCLR